MSLSQLAAPLVLFAFLTPAALAQCSPVHLTAEQDHQRMMGLLHIESLRPGASGNPSAPNAANYDEAKAGPFYPPPLPLVMNNGRLVTSAKDWWRKRRPQIVGAFDNDILGRFPANSPPVRWEVVSTTLERNGNIPVITKKLDGHVDNSACPAIKVDIQVTLSTPADAKGPVPAIMELDFPPEIMAMIAKRFPNLARQNGPTWQQQVLAKGWGYASYLPTSVQPDNGAGLTEGIIGLVNRGQPRSPDDWGALKAWAWGASRALDYFETDKAVNAKEVGLAGHSRYGKAALVAMAYDPRFAIAYISSSGEAGAKLYRHMFGEPIENVAGTSEYHWMAGNFLKYAGPLQVKDLPVDANELIALSAPRPLFIGAGSTAGDGWADAKGSFLAEAEAGSVYELLGVPGLGTSKFPPMGTALATGALAFRQHSDGHTPAPNWPYFVQWAARWLR